MAADKMKNIVLKGRTYYARVKIPEDVLHAFPTAEEWKTLGTGNPHDAMRIAPPIIAEIKKRIADARAGRPVRDAKASANDLPLARAGLARWVVEGPQMHPAHQFAASFTSYTTFRQDDPARNALEDWAKGGDWPARLDPLVGWIVSFGGAKDFLPPDPVVAAMRREVGLEILRAIRANDRKELVAAAEEVTRRAKEHEGDAAPVAPLPIPKMLPAPSITLRQLFDRWMTTKSVDDKEVGRLEHQIRRLIEFVGDKPANHLTKDEVREFMDLVARFPGRKRSAELSALPMRQLVERFEASNAAIIARNAALKPGERPEEVPGTLKASTVDEWFAAYRQMYDYAVAMLDLGVNPFTAVRKFVVKGAPSTKKREFTADEIAKIFSAPMFTGFEGDGERGYRSKVGSNVVRDAKYWLPILALFHGGRLTEFAAMPVADLKQSDTGHWYFDLTERKVKNETSQRVIPVHPKVIELGFLEYADKVRKGNSPWLFPDLDHETKHGSGHAFSKWWGNWMDAHGLTDPTITHHSWRHTWKRAARQSDVKEEMHDVISGHKGPAISRSYGQGADVEPLARDMAKILFPSFPAIPVAA